MYKVWKMTNINQSSIAAVSSPHPVLCTYNRHVRQILTPNTKHLSLTKLTFPLRFGSFCGKIFPICNSKIIEITLMNRRSWLKIIMIYMLNLPKMETLRNEGFGRFGIWGDLTRRRGGRTQVENGQAKSHNKFITGKSCQLFLNLVYGRTFQTNFQQTC